MPSQRRILTWYLRSPKDLSTGNDVDVTYLTRGSVDPVGIRMRARTAPTGQALIVDVKADGISMLDSRVRGVLPAGLSDHRSTNVATMKAPVNAQVKLSLVQVGNKEPGNGVTVEMEVMEATPN